MSNRYGKPVRFIHFPGKKRNEAAARIWINACRRPANQLSLENLTYHHYICSLHWVGEDGPTRLNPDPIPATMAEVARYERETAFRRRTKTSRPQGNIQVDKGLGGCENEGVAQILLDLSSQPVIHAPEQDNVGEMLEATHTLLIQ